MSVTDDLNLPPLPDPYYWYIWYDKFPSLNISIRKDVKKFLSKPETVIVSKDFILIHFDGSLMYPDFGIHTIEDAIAKKAEELHNRFTFKKSDLKYDYSGKYKTVKMED